ncbi:MAG TPA: hypothetical protein VIV64_00845 [Gammaproteobacteria bacterium]|jgi:hypothetical protein
MPVKIVADNETKESLGRDYVRVSTCCDPLDDTVTLATIQRFVEKQHLDEAANRIHVKTLVLRQPMSTDEALGLATCYAKRKQIPVVCTDASEDG